MISYNWELNKGMSIILQIWNNFYVISSQVLTKKKQSTKRIYQDSRRATPQPRKITANLNFTCKNI